MSGVIEPLIADQTYLRTVSSEVGVARKEVLVVLQDEQRCLSSGDGSQLFYPGHIVHYLQVRHGKLAVHSRHARKHANSREGSCVTNGVISKHAIVIYRGIVCTIVQVR